MTQWGTKELAAARDAVASLLDTLKLDAYLYEVELADDHWDVKVEWARGQEWSRETLSVDGVKLLQSPHDEAIRDALLAEWREALGLDA